MATQLAAPIGEEADEHQEQQSEARDFEAEAREHGWTPKEQFKGDPGRWVDAETFVKKADEVMPLLRKKTEVQDRRIADLEKTIRQQTKLLSSAEKRAYDQAVADLKAKQEEAVEAGDVKAFRAIDEQIDKLAKDAKAETKPEQYTIEQAKEAYADFRIENQWYDKGSFANATETESSARIYADALTEKHAKKADEMSPSDFFAMIADLVKEKYPALTGKQPRPKPASDVSAPTGGRSSGGKTYADLPADAKGMCDRLIRRNALPGKDDAEKRAYYTKNYDWS